MIGSAPFVFVSVCIVNWNTRDALRACLNALRAKTLPGDFEVIVVDNASADDSVGMVSAEFSAVKLLPQAQNLMFGPGMNVAVGQATGKHVLLLNSDAEVSVEQVRAMAEFMEQSPRIGACAPREFDGDGKLWPLAPPLPTPGRLLLGAFGARRLACRATSPDEPQECLRGSCIMVRREVGEKVGYFDPGYHFYYEDTDLCAKIRAADYDLRIVAGVTIIHRHAASSKQVDRGRRLVWVTEGFCRYVWKHHTTTSARLCIGIAMLISIGSAFLYLLVTLLTLGFVKSVRQRARVSPQIVGILARMLARRRDSFR
jgi:hypothetical protein